jgi:hypothetical protein
MLRFAESAEDQQKVASAISEDRSNLRSLTSSQGKPYASSRSDLAIDFIAVTMRRMTVQPITQAALDMAAIFAERHNLRGMDAVQLGCAIRA